MPQITGTTKLLGVIGDPIAHSLSPVIHNAAIAHLDLDFTYLAFPVKSIDLATALAGFTAIGVVGCSVTIPHKQAIIPLLTKISPLAKAVGAVNTLINTPSGWCGTNTDVAGFVSPLKAIERDWANTTAVILGNGGAARAVVAGCHQLGCNQIHVVGQNAANLEAFSHSWQDIQLAVNDLDSPSPITIQTHRWDELTTLIAIDNLLLVNATPIGMHPNIDLSPIDAKTMQGLSVNAIVYDLIYTPSPTKFLQFAQALDGIMAIDGLEMLVQQGAVAFELWLQQPAPVDVMRQALIGHLRQKQPMRLENKN
jgi:shikimate dehydrogenase